MTHDHHTRLGTCPDCDAVVRRTDVLIDYTDGDGHRAVWAECPECREVIDPA